MPQERARLKETAGRDEGVGLKGPALNASVRGALTVALTGDGGNHLHELPCSGRSWEGTQNSQATTSKRKSGKVRGGRRRASTRPVHLPESFPGGLS